MGYNMKVFARSGTLIPHQKLRDCLTEAGFEFKLDVAGPKRGKKWTQADLSHPDDHIITSIEPEFVGPGQKQRSWLEEDIECLEDGKPAAETRWVVDFLRQVQITYLFRIYSGTDVEGRFGWEMVWALQELIRDEYDGIVHAEGEGFSNQEGWHITWEFSGRVSGEWNMALLRKSGEWVGFTMDLANRDHRRAFQAGLIPDGVEEVFPIYKMSHDD